MWQPAAAVHWGPDLDGVTPLDQRVGQAPGQLFNSTHCRPEGARHDRYPHGRRTRQGPVERVAGPCATATVSGVTTPSCPVGVAKRSGLGEGMAVAKVTVGAESAQSEKLPHSADSPFEPSAIAADTSRVCCFAGELIGQGPRVPWPGPRRTSLRA